MLSKE
jgi:hypothetical protein